MHTDLEIGFKDTSYTVNEGEEHFSFDVEVKNNVLLGVPIEFTVTDTEGEALSESL